MRRGGRGENDHTGLSRLPGAGWTHLRHGTTVLHEPGLGSSQARAQDHPDERRELGQQKECRDDRTHAESYSPAGRSGRAGDPGECLPASGGFPRARRETARLTQKYVANPTWNPPVRDGGLPSASREDSRR